ncbi:MAG: FtsX-like permease family protein [Chitinophagaceae bacterium]
MIKNYFKIAFRNLWRHKTFSFINIMGLTVGLMAFFLIFMYVKFELSYDSFNSKADRIYRVVADLKTPSETINTSGPAWAVAPNVKDEFPEVEDFVRVSEANLLVRKGDVKFQEENAMWADSALFRVFDFKLLKGNPRTALKEQLSIVFTETAAKKYFGNKDPMGQTLLLTGDAFPSKVTGIMQDMPENSQIKADMLVSMSTLTQKFNSNLDSQWANYGNRTYLLLKPQTNAMALQAKLPAFLEKRNGTQMKQLQMFPKLLFQPLRDVYLHSTRDGSKTGNSNNVYIFSIIAIFILVIACINFINLTTARSAERAKEVGIRKVVGAGKMQLAKQFIGESVLICIIAYILAVIASGLLLSPFNQLSGKIISHSIFEHGSYLIILLVIAIGIGILAGIYPALVLSSFQPVKVLKGRFATGTKGTLLRKALVVAQFTISTGLIIGTIVVYSQMTYMRNQDLGFNKDQKLIIDTHGDPAKNTLKQAIAGLPNVISTSLTGSVPGGGNPGAYSQVENKKGDMQIANLDLYFTDFDYIPQYKIKMVAGRAFSKEMGTDTTQAMVLNETAVKMFGYSSPKDIIGKKFDQWGRKGNIIGVMEDFHFRSLQEVIKPLSMRIEPGGCDLISVNIAATNVQKTIASVENKWKTFIPNRPFNYFFLDEFFDKQYRSEIRFGKLFLNFALLAIFISCLGLLGLASYSTMQRTKEIGIRKVMGASVGGIINLLSKDFLILVLISFVIAAPVAWYGMHSWLKDFAYRIDISWWVFVLAGVMAIVIALGTISFQAIKAAMANPVKSLRTE